jgi:hypothetical protein
VTCQSEAFTLNCERELRLLARAGTGARKHGRFLIGCESSFLSRMVDRLGGELSLEASTIPFM